jgi:excisionase family DNA binding protein
MPQTEQLLSITEAAQELSVSVKTVRKWADAGTIPVVKLPSGHRRFQRSALLAALRAMGYRTPDQADA